MTTRAKEIREFGNTSNINIDSSDVGIGTSTPGRRLHVYSDTHPVILERSDASNTLVEVKTDNSTRGYWGANSNNAFMIYNNTASNINLVVSNTGNVGIGTATPQAALDVRGSIVQYLDNGGISFNKTGAVSSTNRDYYGALLRVDSNGYHYTSTQGGFGSAANDLALMHHGSIAFATTSATGDNSTNYPTGRMIILENGNIGIGRRSADFNLDLEQDMRISGDSPVLRIHAKNTSVSPNPKLEFMRGTHETFGADAYTDWRVEVQNDARFKISSHDTTRGENLRFLINHDTGNVNIGSNTSPAAKLSVQGDILASSRSVFEKGILANAINIGNDGDDDGDYNVTIRTEDTSPLYLQAGRTGDGSSVMINGQQGLKVKSNDVAGEGNNTSVIVGDVNGSENSNGFGYVELHAQDTKWNQHLHYHGGTGQANNTWRVGSYKNTSTGDDYYRFYGRGQSKDMLVLNAGQDRVQVYSPIVYPSTGSATTQSHQINAGPWHHIQSWSITSDTGTPIYFNDVFNNTDYISYKVYIHHWMSATDGDQVYIRLLTGTNTPWAQNYHYTSLHHTDFSGTHSTTTYASTNEARIWEGNWYQASGYGGIDGELTFTNVSSTTIDGRNVDRGTNAYRPNMLSDVCGYSVSGAGGTNSYRRTQGYNRFNVGNNSSYWKGFSIYNSGNNTVKAGASLSIYGLRPAL